MEQHPFTIPAISTGIHHGLAVGTGAHTTGTGHIISATTDGAALTGQATTQAFMQACIILTDMETGATTATTTIATTAATTIMVHEDQWVAQ